MSDFIQRADIDQPIGIDIKGDFDLGNSLGSGRETGELEFTERLVESDQFTFTLEDFDLDGGLTVGGGREDLRFFGRDLKQEQRSLR